MEQAEGLRIIVYERSLSIRSPQCLDVKAGTQQTIQRQ